MNTVQAAQKQPDSAALLVRGEQGEGLCGGLPRVSCWRDSGPARHMQRLAAALFAVSLVMPPCR